MTEPRTAGPSPDVRPSEPMQVIMEVQALLALEVHLLDDRRYDEWLELFTDNCLYWMPVDPTVTDGSMRLNVIYDDRARMADRVARLTGGSAFSEDPPTMTARTVSAVQVEAEGPDTAGQPVVRSNFTIVAYRRGEQRHFGGRYRHRLVREGGRYRIAEKHIVLLGSDAPQRPLTFLF